MIRLPYEMPRLSAIAVRPELPDERGDYETIWEVKAKLVKKGLPVDHLTIEHRADARKPLPPDADGVAG